MNVNLHEKTPLFSQRSAISEAETGSSLEIYKVIKWASLNARLKVVSLNFSCTLLTFESSTAVFALWNFFVFFLDFLIFEDGTGWTKGLLCNTLSEWSTFSLCFSIFLLAEISECIKEKMLFQKIIFLHNHLNHSKVPSTIKYKRSSYTLNLCAYFGEGGGKSRNY